jgi:CheY-like chemotaxis protein
MADTLYELANTLRFGDGPSFTGAAVMSILLVEDDEFARELLEMVLAGSGLDVVAVADGEEAVDLLEQGERFDLLMTDIRLPGHYDGWSLAVEMRRYSPDIPVVYMTASHQQSCPVSRSVYLRKPVKPKLLVSVLSALLGRSLTVKPSVMQASPKVIGVASYIH